MEKATIPHQLHFLLTVENSEKKLKKFAKLCKKLEKLTKKANKNGIVCDVELLDIEKFSEEVRQNFENQKIENSLANTELLRVKQAVSDYEEEEEIDEETAFAEADFEKTIFVKPMIK